MNLPDFYPILTLVASFVMIIVYLWITGRAVHAYRLHHDDRAAVALLLVLMLLVASFGSLISSLGFYLDTRGLLPALGQSMVRGSLLVGGITLILAYRECLRDPYDE